MTRNYHLAEVTRERTNIKRPLTPYSERPIPQNIGRTYIIRKLRRTSGPDSYVGLLRDAPLKILPIILPVTELVEWLIRIWLSRVREGEKISSSAPVTRSTNNGRTI